VSAWTTLRSIPAVLGLIVRAPGWAIDYSLSYRRAKKLFKHSLAELFPFKMSDIIETAKSIN
jgi:hypothetical protein